MQAPLVVGCHANVECRVVNHMESEGVTMFLAQALACHIDNDMTPVSRLAGKTFRLDGPID